MNKSSIILFSLLCANSLIFSADPSDNRKEEKKGTFDQCFDSPVGFAKCAGVGAVVVGGVGGILWASGGLATPWATKAASGIANMFEPSAPTKKSSKSANLAPAKKEEPIQPPSPKRASTPPPAQEKKENPDGVTWNQARNTFILGAAGGLGAKLAVDGCNKAISYLPSSQKEKAEEEERRIAQIRREAEAAAERRFIHCQRSEQNFKVRQTMERLEGKIDAVFLCSDKE